MLRPEWPALPGAVHPIQKFYRVNGGSTAQGHAGYHHADWQ